MRAILKFMSVQDEYNIAVANGSVQEKQEFGHCSSRLLFGKVKTSLLVFKEGLLLWYNIDITSFKLSCMVVGVNGLLTYNLYSFIFQLQC